MITEGGSRMVKVIFGKDFDRNILILRDFIIAFVKKYKTAESAEKAINDGKLSTIMYDNEIGHYFFKKAEKEINKLLNHPRRTYIYDLQEIIDL